MGFGGGLRLQVASEKSADRVDTLWERLHTDGCTESRAALVLHYAGLVRYVVVRLAADLPASVDYDDLVQAGVIGLMDAIDKFEPERGLKFETYAVLRIRGAVLDDLRAQDWTPRSVRAKGRALAEATQALQIRLQRTPTEVELATALGETPAGLAKLRSQLHRSRLAALDELLADAGDGENVDLTDVISDPFAPAVDDGLLEQDLRAILRRALETLPERDRWVLSLSFVEQLTLRQIGTALGVTESRVCQMRTKALAALRVYLRAELHA
jgi:RNA polymerase sigma factor for flagellar operon FliA